MTAIELELDSVRLLKMVNLSCIHIPGEVFQCSEGYYRTMELQYEQE